MYTTSLAFFMNKPFVIPHIRLALKDVFEKDIFFKNIHVVDTNA
jgi:hypothetical protein